MDSGLNPLTVSYTVEVIMKFLFLLTAICACGYSFADAGAEIASAYDGGDTSENGAGRYQNQKRYMNQEHGGEGGGAGGSGGMGGGEGGGQGAGGSGGHGGTGGGFGKARGGGISPGGGGHGRGGR